MSEYTRKANDFLKKNNIRFSISYLGENQPDWDNNYHSEYLCRFTNRNTRKSMSVHFFQSLYNSGKVPTAYDVLACLTKYESVTIDDFVNEFGYEISSWEDVKKVQKTYNAVNREYKGVLRVFGTCLDELQEIA